MPRIRPWQTEPVIHREPATFVLGVLGVALLVFTLWARLGLTPRARRWMSDGVVENWRAERFVVLGAPALGVVLLAVAVLATPFSLAAVRVVAEVLLLLALVPLLWTVLAVIPMPGFLYPAWARRIRTARRSWSRRLS
jgi:hypothetical protein